MGIKKRLIYDITFFNPPIRITLIAH